MPRLSRASACGLLKREDLQPVFSFKLRGAYNKMSASTRGRAAGVICASAGNHAQGVALAARGSEVRAVIVMPRTTPAIKVEPAGPWAPRWCSTATPSTRPCGHARELRGARGLTFVHPFDDPDVIAGQGTIGMEILTQHPGRSMRYSCRSAAAASRPAWRPS